MIDILKCFFISPDFITCSNCLRNYSASQPDSKTFCQEYSINIDPKNEKANNDRGQSCPYWLPGKIEQDKVHVTAPEQERWYEKDSMA